MDHCYICGYEGRLITWQPDQPAFSCPRCGVVYHREVVERVSDLVQRGAPHGVIWHEVFDQYPQPGFRRDMVPILDPDVISRDRSFWDRLEHERTRNSRRRECQYLPDRYTRPVLEAQQQDRQRQMDQARALSQMVAQEAIDRLHQGIMGCTTFMASGSFTPLPTRPLTPEEQEANRRRIEETNAAIAAQRKEIADALAKARALLVEAIGEEAVQKLDMGGTYPVPSKKYKGTEYHLRLKRAPVRVVIGGQTVQEICIQPTANIPDYDMVLALKKMIEFDETVLVGTGNLVGQGARPEQITRNQSWFSQMIERWGPR